MESTARTRKVRFGPFDVDLRSGELRKHGIRLKLQDQPFQLLALLLAHPGDLVTREELRQKLWPADTFVDFDTGLNSAVKKLRDALGDSAEEPRYIQTLPRRGYRFIGAVESLDRQSSTPTGPRTQISVESAAVLAELRTSARRRYRRVLVAAPVLAVLLSFVFGFDLGGIRRRLLGQPMAASIPSIVVLPLENFSR